MTSLLIAAIIAATLACSSDPQAEVSPTEPLPMEDVIATPEAIPEPLATPMSVATAVPTPRQPTATPELDYRRLRVRLLTPLGALIVADRGNDRTLAAAHLADFNKVAEEILPLIELDMSKRANALHSAIVNVRSHPGNVAALEQDRLSLLTDIP